MGRVIRIRAVDAYGLLDVTIERIRRVPGAKRTETYRWHESAVILRLETFACGKMCCEQHVRDLGDGKHFVCSEH